MVTLATTTATTMYAPNQLHQVPLAELQPDPTQPRKYMDPVALDELTASVRQMGIIQPVVCRQDPATGLVYVVAGERRCADTAETDQGGGDRQPNRRHGNQNRRPGISRLLRGRLGYAYRDHDLHERHPRSGHHPGGEKQEKTDVNSQNQRRKAKRK